MSKKDYQAIAGAIYTASVKDPAFTGETRNGLVFELCVIFKADNSAFDRARFIEACETGRTKGMRQVA
jgi:hypothetical protein